MYKERRGSRSRREEGASRPNSGEKSGARVSKVVDV
jgi:hypothetical protein